LNQQIFRFIFFQIARIDATRSPVLYFVKNLLGVEQKGSFYEQELFPAPTPGEKITEKNQ